MKRTVFILSVVLTCICTGSCSHGSGDPYVDFVKKQRSPEDYVLSLFDRFDVVVLCERDHAEMTQYDFILNLLSDKRFIEKSGHVFMEIGAENYKSRIDSLMFADGLTDPEVRKKVLAVNRDMSFYPIWNNTTYSKFLTGVYEINRNLGKDSKIRLYPTDRAFSWYGIETFGQYEQFLQEEVFRDSLMAVNTMKYLPGILASGKKALIIQNSVHAFKIREDRKNYYYYLQQSLDRPVASVLVHTLAMNWTDGSRSLVNGGRWDSAFNTVGKDLGFDFEGNVFGEDSFDLISDRPTELKYKDVFTGMVYYKPVTGFVWSWGVPGIISEDFEAEISRRHKLVDYPYDIKTIKEWYDTTTVRTYKDIIPDYEKYLE